MNGKRKFLNPGNKYHNTYVKEIEKILSHKRIHGQSL